MERRHSASGRLPLMIRGRSDVANNSDPIEACLYAGRAIGGDCHRGDSDGVVVAGGAAGAGGGEAGAVSGEFEADCFGDAQLSRCASNVSHQYQFHP